LLTSPLLEVIKTAEGSSTIRLGETCVICGIKAEISEPTFTDPKRGFVGEYGVTSC
jgi:exosome complex component RRP43